jgi:hypothetical protein
MNYLAALVLVGVGMDEHVAFTIFVALMEHPRYNLKHLYTNRLKGVSDVSEALQAEMEQEMPLVMERVLALKLPMFTYCMTPLVGLFANLLEIDISLHVLDRVIL